jgi:hypothetical protein
MSQTIGGSNKNPCTPAAVELDWYGTYLITKTNEYLVVPASFGIREIQMRNIGPTLDSNSSSKLILYLGKVGDSDIDIFECSLNDLNDNDSVSMIGTDGSLIYKALDYDTNLMVKTDNGALEYGAVISVIVKMKGF